MQESQYRTFLSNYLEYQRNKLVLLEGHNIPSFKVFQFSVRDISDANHIKWTQNLIELGLNNKCSVLYYFRIKGLFDRKEIASIITKMKMKPGKSERALPKVNSVGDHGEFDILYVGKTNTKFLDRFKQHLGLGARSTYALHLIHWAKEMNLILEMNFAVCNLEENNTNLLEHIESVLHYSMNPILGRQGH